jgi:ATP-binding cassette subfamily B protein
MSEKPADKQKRASGFHEAVVLLRYGVGLVLRMTRGFIPITLAKGFVTALQPLAALFFSARILNELAGGRNVRAIILYAAITVALTFGLSVAKALLLRASETFTGWERLLHRLRMMVAERFARMDYAYAEDGKISETLARMDTQAMGNGLGLLNVYLHIDRTSQQVFSLVFSFLLLAGTLSVPAAGGASLPYWGVIILLGLFAAGLLITLRYRLHEKTVLEKIYVENARANTAAHFYGTYIDADQAAKDVRLYDQSAMLEKIFRDSFNAKSWVTFFLFEGRLSGFSAGMLALLGGGFYLLAGLQALGGAGTIGGLVQVVGSVLVFAEAVGTLVTLAGQAYNNAAFIKPLRDFLTLPDTLAKGTRPVPPPNGRKYVVEFRGVSFRYPGAESYALKDLCLTLRPGQRLAVVGLNGSGKTTMIKLLCRLYDPTEGEILLDGVNIKEYDPVRYAELFSVVFQDFNLFPLWLGQNVAASDTVDEERARASLTAARFGERLETMPDGLDTVLYKRFDEDGTQVSGGEAQKIAFARALYKDAPIVVLDEPTAALDPIAEYEVYTTFNETIGDKTAVFISHRLSSCRFCHSIAVFDRGRLVQQGDHETLLNDEEGRYRELWDAQAKHYEEEAAG